MTAPAPLFASDRSAAKLLDMRLAEFRGLVAEGHLPGPRDIGGIARWDVEQLRAIGRGDASEPIGGIGW